MLKKHGTIYHIGASVSSETRPLLNPATIAEEKPIKLIIKAMPGIRGFIEEKLATGSRLNGDARR